MNPQSSIPTFALIIGVSNSQFDQLPAAKEDAAHLARSLAEWGIPRNNIFLLNGPQVMRAQLEENLAQLASIPGPFKLLFYFCGHGDRSRGQNPESSLIFSDGEIPLKSIFEVLYTLNTSALYIFIDACHLRLNSIVNPNRTLFCLLSSGIFPSYESVEHQYGYFTNALIKALNILRHTDRSPVRLLSLIQKELAAHGLPQPEMYNIGTHSIDLFPRIDETKKAIAAVYSCGGFIDEELFCEVFGIGVKTLEKSGLIFYDKGYWHLHDSLIEIAETEQLAVEQDLAKLYWSKQLEDRPNHFESALHFVITLQCFGYEPQYERLLKSAFKILRPDPRALSVLQKSPALYNHPYPPSAVYLAEILIELQQFDLAKTLLDKQSPTKTHLLWRTGSFSKCIDEATEQIDALSDPGAKIPYCFHRGTAHYFLGNWDRAHADFSFIERHSKDPQSIGRARCLLGTITGIRGLDLKNSKAQVESGVRMLMKSSDLAGAWVGWNNLGEMMWKAGELKSSGQYLQKALEIAETTAMLLETLRNMLQLELRSPHRSESKINALLNQIEPLLKKQLETFETMQLYNTLCTTYYYLGELGRAQEYLRKAVPLTILSKEYHIYTLSNLSLLERSNAYFEEALALAKEGKNLFAIEQIRHDHLLSAF